jgi:hypothetical protein
VSTKGLPTEEMQRKSELGNSDASQNARGTRAGVVDGHLEEYSHAGFAVGQLLDAHDLGYVFAGHGIMGGGEGKRDEDAHALVVFLAAADEIDALFGGVDADGEVLEMVVARLRGANAQWAGDFGAAAASLDRVIVFGHFCHGGRAGRYTHYCPWRMNRQGGELYQILGRWGSKVGQRGEKDG